MDQSHLKFTLIKSSIKKKDLRQQSNGLWGGHRSNGRKRARRHWKIKLGYGLTCIKNWWEQFTSASSVLPLPTTNWHVLKCSPCMACSLSVSDTDNKTESSELNGITTYLHTSTMHMCTYLTLNSQWYDTTITITQYSLFRYTYHAYLDHSSHRGWLETAGDSL